MGFTPEVLTPLCRAQSTLTNKSRLRLLQQREEHLQDLFSSARTSIVSLAKDEHRYVQFLENVILQGMLSLMEASVIVRSRAKDVKIAEKAGDGAAKQYQKISGRSVKVTVEGVLSDELCVSSICYPPRLLDIGHAFIGPEALH